MKHRNAVMHGNEIESNRGEICDVFSSLDIILNIQPEIESFQYQQL